MSLSAAHESKQIQRTCQGCGARRARFRYRGIVKADRDHTLCFECFRAERNRVNCQKLPGTTFRHLMSAVSATSEEVHALTYCRVGRRVV